jgi:hypothetical protein
MEDILFALNYCVHLLQISNNAIPVTLLHFTGLRTLMAKTPILITK